MCQKRKCNLVWCRVLSRLSHFLCVLSLAGALCCSTVCQPNGTIPCAASRSNRASADSAESTASRWVNLPDTRSAGRPPIATISGCICLICSIVVWLIVQAYFIHKLLTHYIHPCTETRRQRREAVPRNGTEPLAPWTTLRPATRSGRAGPLGGCQLRATTKNERRQQPRLCQSRGHSRRTRTICATAELASIINRTIDKLYIRHTIIYLVQCIQRITADDDAIAEQRLVRCNRLAQSLQHRFGGRGQQQKHGHIAEVAVQLVQQLRQRENRFGVEFATVQSQ